MPEVASTVNSGLSDVMLNNVITGQIPRRIVVAMVLNKAFTGDIKENPFNFQHFNINYLAANIDGVQYPTLAYQPDFTNDLYIREYLSIFEAYNQITTDSVINLHILHYEDGNVMFGFNFSQDSTDDYYKVGYTNAKKEGSLGLHLKFSTALENSINVLIYCEYDNLIEIDVERQVKTDFQ